jgi:septum formation topological specificity factor MinE
MNLFNRNRKQPQAAQRLQTVIENDRQAMAAAQLDALYRDFYAMVADYQNDNKLCFTVEHLAYGLRDLENARAQYAKQFNS